MKNIKAETHHYAGSPALRLKLYAQKISQIKKEKK